MVRPTHSWRRRAVEAVRRRRTGRQREQVPSRFADWASDTIVITSRGNLADYVDPGPPREGDE
jgi:hypothetical protein